MHSFKAFAQVSAAHILTNSTSLSFCFVSDSLLNDRKQEKRCTVCHLYIGAVHPIFIPLSLFSVSLFTVLDVSLSPMLRFVSRCVLLSLLLTYCPTEYTHRNIKKRRCLAQPENNTRILGLIETQQNLVVLYKFLLNCLSDCK